MNTLENTDFKMIFEASPGLTLVLSPDLNIVAVSDTYLTATTTTRNNIVGKHLFDVFPNDPDDANATVVSTLRASLSEVLNTKLPDMIEARKYDLQRLWSAETALEERYWSQLNYPVLDANNDLMYIIHLVEDVTDIVQIRKQNAEEIVRLTDSLRINKMELENALAKEKGLNEMKSRFVSMASHEFRTPLSTIQSSADLIRMLIDSQRPEKTFKHVERIKASVRLLAEILSDFLSIDTLNSGKIKPTPSLFNLRQVLNEVVSELDGVLKENQRISTVYSGPDKVVSDKTIVRHIVANLLMNAIKFSEKEVTLETEVTKDLISITIVDKGIGIPKEDHENLFNLFFRASNATMIQGTGLGLHIVMRYLKLIGGHIRFETELNAGSRFFISIPNKSK